MNNNRRQQIFDSNRNLIQPAEMANANIEELQQAMIRMQEHHQQEIETLRQQLAQPERILQLTADQVLNKFQHIRTYYGKDDYSLHEFISAVENVCSLCGNNVALLQFGLQIVFREKLQGEAKRTIQRLGDNLTWDAVKAELKVQFRPRKSYKRIMDESRNLKVSNLRELFNIVKSINCQLNELYEYDENKPTNYNPDNNDKNLVDIIKDSLTGSYRINIRHNMTLNDVFNIFNELDLLDENDVIHYKYRKNSKDLRQNFSNNNRKNNINDRGNSNNHHQNNQKTNYSNNYNYQNQNRNSANNNNFKTNSGQSRRTENNVQYRNNNYTNNQSGQSRQNFNRNHYNNNNTDNNNNRNNIHNSDVPMDIDNIQSSEVNFIAPPQIENYP